MNNTLDKLIKAMDQETPQFKSLCRSHVKQQKNAYCLFSSEFVFEYACVAMLSHRLKTSSYKKWHDDTARVGNTLCAISNWRYARGIYQFDETVYNELIKQALEVLPAMLLVKLPQRSVFVQTYENSYTGKGFLLISMKK